MSKHVLVVDDESKVCEALKALFERKGCHVDTAASVQAALTQLSRLQAEVVLLDLKLPDGSGLEVLSHLKEKFPNLRVIVISGLSDQDTIHEALQRGASGYLTKPFDFDRCFYTAMGVEVVDLTAVQADPEAIARVPRDVAAESRALPLRFCDGTLELAMADPLDAQRLADLKGRLGCEIKPFAAIRGDIAETIRQWYGPGVTESTESLEEATGGIERLVSDLMQHAYAGRATDLHLGISSHGPWLRERIDGILYEVPATAELRASYHRLVSRIKGMARLDVSASRHPQHGRIWFTTGSATLDLRVSVLPSLHGESLAIRLIEPARVLPLGQLGFTEEQLREVESLLAKPSGLPLVAGPSGSGRSTSLYALLSKLHTGRFNIVTIEDSIEHELPGLTQVHVQPEAGLTVAAGLRSMRSHDSDIIMVEELRDPESASLAVQVALDGHVVLAGLNTTDAASGITRLLDLGVEPFVLCSALSGILSQRLLRSLCRACRTSTELNTANLSSVGLTVPAYKGAVRMWHAKGCGTCRRSGYAGRSGVFEVLVVDHHIRSLILKRTSSAQLRQSAISRGMSSLWASGWRAVQAGMTSVEELTRALPPELR